MITQAKKSHAQIMLRLQDMCFNKTLHEPRWIFIDQNIKTAFSPCLGTNLIDAMKLFLNTLDFILFICFVCSIAQFSVS